MKKMLTLITAVGLLAGWVQADTFTGFSMDFVSIGDSGNTSNSVGRGAVGYDYRMGTTEVTIEQFNASGVGSATGAAGTPAVNVTWHEAAMFCNWLTFNASGGSVSGAYLMNGSTVTGMLDRATITSSGSMYYVLPTSDEWHKAAFYSGGSYSTYANGTGTAPVAGTEANYNNANSATWVVGSGSIEQNGTFDMAGNAWEWAESGDGVPDTRQFILGSSWAGGTQPLKDSYDPLLDLPMTTESDQLGFRVAAIPEPGTISLMSLSTLSLFLTRTIRRRRRFGASLMPVRHGPACDSFITAEERARQEAIAAQGGFSDPIVAIMQEQMVAAWEQTRMAWKRADTAFWNYMVKRYERRLDRRTAFRTKAKKRLIDGFDAFLARIMK